MSATIHDLAAVDVLVSNIIDAPADSVWGVVRVYSELSVWVPQIDSQSLHSSLLPGDVEFKVGCTRMLQIGGSKLFEQLTAFDDDRRRLSYKLISHPLNSNPFPSSFINYQSEYRVLPVTMGDKAYVEMHGTFLTDHQYMGVMHQTVTHMYETCLRNLQSYMSRVGPLLQNSGGSTSVSGSRAMGHMVPAGLAGTGPSSGDYTSAAELINSGGSSING